jgi:hypothetical protein
MMKCALSLNGVMAGHSPSKTGVNALLFPAIHVLILGDKEDVDARDKRRHDGTVATIGVHP